MRFKVLTIAIACILFSCSTGKQKQPDSSKNQPVAQTPPMGWNSYDCFGAAVTEAEVRANAEYMARHLKEFGWEYIVVDYCWYYPHPPGSKQDNPPQFRLPKDNATVPWMPMDEHSLLYPCPVKFPSSANGAGFKPLADYVHSLGLKFGVHIMRGIPRQAVWAKSQTITQGITADMIADTTSKCPWLNLMYGVDMSKPGAQEYYNSMFDLLAEWGVDFVKVDDIDLNDNYPYRADETEAYRKAIDQCERPMVLSLSLNLKHRHADHIQQNADMWRISRDFWDDWDKLKAQFSLCAQWASYSGPNSWPDADMLPVGNLRLRGPFGQPGQSKFTSDEHYTLFTLWSIARSPLMLGGNLPDNDAFLMSLITNPEIFNVNQNSIGGKEIFNNDSIVIWSAGFPGSDDKVLAIFNISDNNESFTIDFKNFGFPAENSVRNLWKREDMGNYDNSITVELNAHGAQMYLLTK